MVHADRGVVAGARGLGEHRVRRPGTGHVDSLGAQPLDRGHDDGRLLAAHGAALAGMGIEPGDREARRGDAEIRAQRLVRGPRRGDDAFRAQRGQRVAQGHVHRDRHDAQHWAREHHHLPPRNAGQRGEELRVARVAEPCIVEDRLADRVGDDPARLARQCEACRLFDRADDSRRIRAIGPSQHDGRSKGHGKDRKRGRENGECLCDVRNASRLPLDGRIGQHREAGPGRA